MIRRRAWTPPLLAAVLVLAACSDDDDNDTAPTTTEQAPLITSAETVPETTAAPTTSEPEEEEYDRMPLTGRILDDDEEAPDRPALVVKVDNVRGAWPQYGLNSADIIFEEIVNDNVTRFAVVFHSQDAERVGPIRSGRLQDIDLLGSLNRPLFAWSGGNARVDAEVAASDLIDLKHGTHGDLYYRDSSHASKTEWTLFSGTEALWGAAPGDAEAPTPIFDYLGPDEAFEGDPAPGVQVQLDSYEARWEWNADEGRYYRFTNGAPHQTADAGQLTTDNVVVLQMEYVPSPADARSPDAVTANTRGPAWVFADGQVIEGTWARKGRLDSFHLSTGNGGQRQTLELPPGRTFVEMARNTDEGVPQVIAETPDDPSGE